MPANSENFNASIPYVWIGRAPFSADNYLKQTLVSDIRLYGKVLGTAEINALSQITEDLEHEFRYGTPGDFTACEPPSGKQKISWPDMLQFIRKLPWRFTWMKSTWPKPSLKKEK